MSEEWEYGGISWPSSNLEKIKERIKKIRGVTIFDELDHADEAWIVETLEKFAEALAAYSRDHLRGGHAQKLLKEAAEAK